MTDYTKTTDFTSKDSLPSGDSGKIIRGAEFGTEFDNIQTAVNSKSNINNPAFTGNITVTGTVDGRDIAADGTKLDTIETSADVTDTANVTAAGAVMDSELTNIAAVKALNQGVATTDSPTFAAVTSTGNVTVGGTVDGRDVAADGTKLDGIEAGATADQTAAQIKTAYESNADTNAFTDADHTKLDGIEASADVTDTTNVTAAGALMDSEVTNLAQVKAFSSADYATAAQGTTADNALPKTGGAMTGAITTNSTFDGRDVATDGTKLDGIEASADVTDTANVTAAGALMDSELTSEASVKALNQGVATTDSPTFAAVTVNGNVEFDGLSGTGAVTVTDILDQDDMSGNSATALATQQSIKAYVDSQVATADTLAEVLANGNTTGGTDFSVSSGDDVKFADDSKALFGAGNDLKIYHSANNQSYIHEAGSGDLNILASNFKVQNGAGTENKIVANTDGAVTLYYDNAAKIATTSTGIDVTGSVVADGLTVDGASAFNSTATFSDGSEARFGASNNMGLFYSSGTSFIRVNSGIFKLRADDMRFTAQNGTTNKLTLASNGDISFYEDTGTTAKLTWSAASESLTFGTNLAITTNEIDVSSGDLTLDVAGNIKLDADSSNIYLADGGTDIGLLSTNNQDLNIRNLISNKDIYFQGNDGGSTITALTLDMSNAGEATFNDDINLHDGKRLRMGAGGDFEIFHDGSNNIFKGATSDQDMKFNGVDGGSEITALLLDMSAAGAATFNSDVGIGATPNTYSGYTTLTLGSSSNGGLIDFERNGTIKGEIFTEAAIFGFQTIQADDDIVFRGNDGGSTITALTLDMSDFGGAIFNSHVTVPTDLYVGQSIIHNGDADTSIDFDTNLMEFRTAGTARMRISSAGLIQIGNAGSASSPTIQSLIDPDTGIFFGGANILGFSTGGSERLRIDSNGQLLLGTTENVFGGADRYGFNFYANGQSNQSIDGTSDAVAQYINRENADGAFTEFYKDRAKVGSIGVANGDLNINGDSGIRFQDTSIMPRRAGSDVDATVDIGLSSHRWKDLYLSGTANVGGLSASTSGNQTVLFESTGGAATLQFRTASGSISNYIRSGTGGSAVLQFMTAGENERARIDASGNLLVGCTSGGAKVVTEAVPTGTAYLAKWSATGGSALYLEVGGSAVGTITCTASATAYNTSSDQRLKDNIVDAPSASDDIDAIQVRSFNWKVDGSHQKYGMVAQELNTVAPEAVSTPEDSEEMMGVDYSKLVPMLVKEIQSLRARVAQLETN